jgi:hypothetical protein
MDESKCHIKSQTVLNNVESRNDSFKTVLSFPFLSFPLSKTQGKEELVLIM